MPLEVTIDIPAECLASKRRSTSCREKVTSLWMPTITCKKLPMLVLIILAQCQISSSLVVEREGEAQQLLHNAKRQAAPALRYFQRHFKIIAIRATVTVCKNQPLHSFGLDWGHSKSTAAVSLSQLRFLPALDNYTVINFPQSELLLVWMSAPVRWNGHGKDPDWQVAARDFLSSASCLHQRSMRVHDFPSAAVDDNPLKACWRTRLKLP